MVNLATYRRMAPFTIDELVDASNAVLKSAGRHLVSKRTLRYYITQSLVPRPLGSPKFARYGFEHLVAVLAVRALQDQGLTLDKIQVETAEIGRGRTERLESIVGNWLSRSESVREGTMRYVAPKAEESGEPELPAFVDGIYQIRLQHGGVLDLPAGEDVYDQMRQAVADIEHLIKTGR